MKETAGSLRAYFIIAGDAADVPARRAVAFTKQLLVLAGVMLFVDGALITAAFGTEVGQSGITGALVGLLIVIYLYYLYRSVVRLATEAVPHAPPEAKAL